VGLGTRNEVGLRTGDVVALWTGDMGLGGLWAREGMCVCMGVMRVGMGIRMCLRLRLRRGRVRD
jgi:hypothetical protein